jgi:cyclopropane fatty-acyl-phospholipid synthase-like methyltransferase
MTEALRNHRADIAGKRVLDLGSNAGHFPMLYSELCAARVTAVEPRMVFAGWFHCELCKHDESRRVTWRQADVRDYTATPHDVLSCLGLIYHVHDGWRHLDRIVAESGAKLMFFDSMLWPRESIAIETSRFNSNCAKAVEIVPHPSRASVEREFDKRGWHYRLLLENWPKDALRGLWRVELPPNEKALRRCADNPK